MNQVRKDDAIMKENKLSIVRGILCFIPAVITFAVSYLLVFILLVLLFELLFNIPVIGSLLGFFFHKRGDSPEILASIIGAGSAVLSTCSIVIKMSKSTRTAGLSCLLTGVVVFVIHAISFVLNIVHGEPVFPNIFQAIAGLFLITTGYSNLTGKASDLI